jgi:hypothetical protein
LIITRVLSNEGHAPALREFEALSVFLAGTVLPLCLDHLSFLASRLSTVAFFLHFDEQYQNVAASFLMNITPVPSEISLLQKEQRF